MVEILESEKKNMKGKKNMKDKKNMKGGNKRRFIKEGFFAVREGSNGVVKFDEMDKLFESIF